MKTGTVLLSLWQKCKEYNPKLARGEETNKKSQGGKITYVHVCVCMYVNIYVNTHMYVCVYDTDGVSTNYEANPIALELGWMQKKCMH